MEAVDVRPSDVCQAWLLFVMESRKGRKAGLPKREPPWSVGGHDLMVSSMESSMKIMSRTTLSVVDTEEIFLPAAASESENTKARMRE